MAETAVKQPRSIALLSSLRPPLADAFGQKSRIAAELASPCRYFAISCSNSSREVEIAVAILTLFAPGNSCRFQKTSELH